MPSWEITDEFALYADVSMTGYAMGVLVSDGSKKELWGGSVSLFDFKSSLPLTGFSLVVLENPDDYPRNFTGWGVGLYPRYRNLTGLYAGLWNSTWGDMAGVQLGLVNSSEANMTGLQLAVFGNSSNRNMKGIQIGAINTVGNLDYPN